MVRRTFLCRPIHYPYCEWPGGRLLLMPPGPVGNLDQEAPAFSQFNALTEGGESAIIETLGPGDILAVQLFYNQMAPGRARDCGVQFLPDYKGTLRLVQMAAARRVGILVGQQHGVELSYRHAYGGWRGDARGNLRAIREFILNTSEILRGVGVEKLFFAVMDWDVLQELRRDKWIVRDALNEVGATNWIACGYTLVPGCYVKPDTTGLLNGDQLRHQSQMMGWGFQDLAPDADLPHLREYLSAGHFWSGLGGDKGIRAGNIERLTAYGFKGFSTRLKAEELQLLIDDRGPRWWCQV